MTLPGEEEKGRACEGAQAKADAKASASRRKFLAFTAGVVGLVGAVSMALSLANPLSRREKPKRAPVKVDISRLKEGDSLTALWQGKPVFIRRRTAQEMATVRAVSLKDLRDPQTDDERFLSSVEGGKAEWLVVVGVCTHLGCVPLGQKQGDRRGDFEGWFCPCHGAQFDSSARIRKGPAPKNMKVPPYRFVDDTHIEIG